MALTDVAVRQAKTDNKTKKLSDGGGLFLEVRPSGAKYWRMAYRYGGKQKLLAFGVYPRVTLADARGKREEAHKALAKDIDPGTLRKAMLNAQTENCELFKSVAVEWHTKFKQTWTDGHAITIMSRLTRDVFPWIGSRPISELKPLEVLSVLQRVESRGALESAHRIRTVLGQIFRYAVATGRAERDCSVDLRGALPQPTKKHMAAIMDPNKVGGLLRAIDGYEGSFIVRCALQLAPQFFLRPGELRQAEWKEFDLDRAEWNIPVDRLKLTKKIKADRKGDFHLVPLSRQALTILRDIYQLTGTTRYVFPSPRSTKRPLSDNAILSALRRMGYPKEEMTGHGFRAIARTLLDEKLRIRPDFIEHQMAHTVRDAQGRAYNRTSFVEDRFEMMQKWSDYLDELKADATCK